MTNYYQSIYSATARSKVSEILGYFSSAIKTEYGSNTRYEVTVLASELIFEQSVMDETNLARSVDNATGWSLDLLASLLNVSRDPGEDDESFRQRIKVQSLIQASSGTLEDIYNITTLVTGLNNTNATIVSTYTGPNEYEIHEQPALGPAYPDATFLIHISEETLGELNTVPLYSALDAAKAAGVSYWGLSFISTPDPLYTDAELEANYYFTPHQVEEYTDTDNAAYEYVFILEPVPDEYQAQSVTNVYTAYGYNGYGSLDGPESIIGFGTFDITLTANYYFTPHEKPLYTDTDQADYTYIHILDLNEYTDSDQSDLEYTFLFIIPDEYQAQSVKDVYSGYGDHGYGCLEKTSTFSRYGGSDITLTISYSEGYTVIFNTSKTTSNPTTTIYSLSLETSPQTSTSTPNTITAGYDDYGYETLENIDINWGYDDEDITTTLTVTST